MNSVKHVSNIPVDVQSVDICPVDLQSAPIPTSEEVWVYLRVEYSTSPGMGPIMSCWQAGHLGSGVGDPDLNQYFPFPCLFVIATIESSCDRTRS